MTGYAETIIEQTKDRLITIKEVMARTSLSRAHVYTLVKRGDLPAPIKLGAKCSRWSEQELDRWIADRAN
ncbi:MAG: hypothetical protein BGO57_12430 [Sphingomonadales bacterium 63-6]|nr:MAG: hypothetical protein BGO57_12430 [Sphingomonadales bacterium 63-6]